MKKLFIAALALIGTSTAFAQKKVADVAKLSVETFDFGKIKQNVPAVATFTITNIGNEPIIIENAQPTCGCTIGDYTKSPIAPGKSGTITATYNAVALGAIHKTISLKLAGIDEMKQLGLGGEVLDEAAYVKYTSGNKSNAAATKEIKKEAKQDAKDVKDANKTTDKSKKAKKASNTTSKKTTATTPKS